MAKDINPNSLENLQDCRLETALSGVSSGEAVQFERLGYFCADSTSTPDGLVFNRTVGLRDTFAKAMTGKKP